MKIPKLIRVKCWMAITEDNEFQICSTKKQAKQAVLDFKGFDVYAKVKKILLTIEIL